jgi:small subunit ribosomal protein S14
MKYLNLKDRRRRILYMMFEKKANILKSFIKNLKVSKKKRSEIYMELIKLPKDSSIVRLRNRCGLTNRPRGVYRMFGISRLMFRKYM